MLSCVPISQPYNLPPAGEGLVEFIPFPRILALCKIQPHSRFEPGKPSLSISITSTITFRAIYTE